MLFPPFGNQTTGSSMRRVPKHTHFLIKNLLCKNCQCHTCTQIIVDILSPPTLLKILSSKFLKMPMQALILQAQHNIIRFLFMVVLTRTRVCQLLHRKYISNIELCLWPIKVCIKINHNKITQTAVQYNLLLMKLYTLGV